MNEKETEFEAASSGEQSALGIHPASQPSVDCPECGAANTSDRITCWLCEAWLGRCAGAVLHSDNPCPRCGESRSELEASCKGCGWTPPPIREQVSNAKVTWAMRRHALRSFSLESIMLVVTLIAVCLGVLIQAPGVGVVLVVLATPALVRVIGIRLRRKALGQPMAAGEKVLAFAGSLAVVSTIAIASSVTFVGICFSLGLAGFETRSDGLMVLGWVLGIGLGLTVGIFLIVKLWRKR